MILYKLTRQDMTTHKNFTWELKKPSVLLPPGGQLCSSSFYHAYLSPELAVLLNPIHANYQNPRLFEAEGDVAARDHDLKVGVKQLTLLTEIPLPVVSATQLVVFAVLVSKSVYKESGFNKWADDWLNNKDRSARAAARAASAADAAYAADCAAARAGIKLDLISLAKECLKY